MSTAINQKIGTKTAFTITLNSLVSATYVAASAVDFLSITGVTTGTVPLDVIIEVTITPGSTTTNKQVLLFTQISLDNSVFSTGPTSGTTTTDQDDLYFIGRLPLNTASTQQTKSFSVVSALGFMPRVLKPVILNDSGAGLGSSGNALSYAIVTGDAT